MAITNFQPEIWSATLLSVLRKSLVFGALANRDYEGEIANAGDTVHIVSIGDPTIGNYTKDTDITIQVLTDADRTLVIDQQKYFGFEIDDIDMRQAASGGALMTEAATRAGFGLGDTADQFLAAKLALAATNLSPTTVIDATTATNVYDLFLVPAGVALDQNNVPTQGRVAVIPPAMYGKLQLDARFVRQNESGTSALHTGEVGAAAGFTIVKSNNAFQSNRTGITATTVSGAKGLTGAAGTFNQGDVGLTVTGTGIGGSNKIASVNADGSVAQTTVNQSASATVTDIALAGGGQMAYAGTKQGLTYAEQINKVEAFRPEKRFADALKGLHLYGAKVVRPECLVVASVKTS
jgi:N4-gp56 family major capsid protein